MFSQHRPSRYGLVPKAAIHRPVNVNTPISTLWQLNPTNPTTFAETSQTIDSFPPIDLYVSPRGRQQYSQYSQPQQLQTPTSLSAGSSTLESLGFHFPPELQTNMQNYPSPQYSDVSGPTFQAHQKKVQGSTLSPIMQVMPSSQRCRKLGLASVQPQVSRADS